MASDDLAIFSRISELIEEERKLRESHVGTPLRSDERERLEAVEVELDQCWDLLNQRRALREYGADPDKATVRDETTVEHYQQ
jgi:hypothetical protein